MRFETIAISQEGPIAAIRLNRPARGNPVDALFLQELATATAELHDDASVLAVLITAEGEVFSCGREGAAKDSTPDGPLPFRCLELIGQPAIVVIEGDAIGAGLELALACDVRFAAAGAMLALPDVTMGAMPSGGATQRLPRLVGRAKATELILLGEPISGEAAVACGLINHIAPRGEVRAAAVAFASKIAERGPIAVRYAKEALLRGLDMPLDQALRYETDLTIILQTTADRAEGVRAFSEKRAPKFTGQ
ncbi:MAG: enoyl-CoA hydratase-related protein [Chloroflexota bacterium]|nr:enoyl-CoA hydratase-related protein [Chloroflexota bacterium]